MIASRRLRLLARAAFLIASSAAVLAILEFLEDRELRSGLLSFSMLGIACYLAALGFYPRKPSPDDIKGPTQHS